MARNVTKTAGTAVPQSVIALLCPTARPKTAAASKSAGAQIATPKLTLGQGPVVSKLDPGGLRLPVSNTVQTPTQIKWRLPAGGLSFQGSSLKERLPGLLLRAGIVGTGVAGTQLAVDAYMRRRAQKAQAKKDEEAKATAATTESVATTEKAALDIACRNILRNRRTA